MRIRENDRRNRLYEALMDATGENTKSGALDVAARFYCKMAGENPVAPQGQLSGAMSRAMIEGSLTATELTEELSTEELPIHYNRECSVGRDDGVEVMPEI